MLKDSVHKKLHYKNDVSHDHPALIGIDPLTLNSSTSEIKTYGMFAHGQHLADG